MIDQHKNYRVPKKLKRNGRRNTFNGKENITKSEILEHLRLLLRTGAHVSPTEMERLERYVLDQIAPDLTELIDSVPDIVLGVSREEEKIVVKSQIKKWKEEAKR